MANIKTKSASNDIIDKIKKQYGKMAFWSEIEGQIALYCSEIPEPTDLKSNKKFIEQINKIRRYLIDYGVERGATSFLVDEIKIVEETKLISLYKESDDNLPEGLVDAYSTIAPTSEGILNIGNPLNYSQLSKLTNEVYKKTGLIKFFISNEKEYKGKIVAEHFSQSLNLTIATLFESKKRDKGNNEPENKGVLLFGQPIVRKEINVLKEITAPMYIYQFISSNNEEYLIVSPTQTTIGDYIVKGVETACSDYRAVTESARIPTKLPFIFAHSLKNRVVKYKNNDEFLEKLNKLNIPEKEFFLYPFCSSNEGEDIELLQPLWYKWFMWSWLTHAPSGKFGKYPLHIIQICEKNSGKSLMQNTLHSRTNEALSVFSGSSSTLKNLIPSFKNNPAKLGYLAESNRFSYCDEFLRCVLKTNSMESGGFREEAVGSMNDMLEHQRREAGSGNSSVKINMTSRVFATTNPVRGTGVMSSLLRVLDHSFLSRWIIYYQTNEHYRMILDSKDSDLRVMKYNLQNEDWVSILDYLHSFPAKYDHNRVAKLYFSLKGTLSEDLNKHYEARHQHHMDCIIDGIIKTRCLITKDMKFEAIDEDYKILSKIWLSIIGSWMTPETIKNTPKTQRIYLMPENAQFLYWKIFNIREEIEYQALVEIVREELKGQAFLDAYYELKNNDLIVQVLGKVQTYDYFKAKSDENEKITGQREL